MTRPIIESGITIAERDRIDQIITAMSEDYQKRALTNFPTELIQAEMQRRNEKKQAIVENCYKVIYSYENKAFDINVMEEFISAMKGALDGISRC